MRKIIIMTMLAFAIGVNAQQHEGKPGAPFSPEEFQQKMVSHITKEANLTEAEAGRVMPIFIELMKKKREFNNSKRELQHKVCEQSSEQEAEAALSKIDQLNIEEAQTEQAYHKKMVEAIGAQKVMKTLKAVDNFHRQMFRRNGIPGGQKGHGGNGRGHKNQR